MFIGASLFLRTLVGMKVLWLAGRFGGGKTLLSFALGLWLKEQERCEVTLYNGVPLSVAPPNFVELEIVETDPGLKGDTATGGSKPATLSTGAVVKVPLFLSEGEVIRVDTRTGEYQGRAGKS